MSHNLTGIYFENQVIASKGLRAHARKVLSDGVIQGCELSFSGASVTIAPGFLMAGGGLMHNSAAQTLEVSGATSGYARIKAIIDLSKTATKTAFEQAWFEVDYSSTLEGFADPVQEDINAGGTVYEVQMCVVSLTAGGVSEIITAAPSAGTNGLGVDDIFITFNPTSPAERFGGDWEQIKDVFLLAAGDTYAVGSIGGEAEHTLTVDEIPSHQHTTKGAMVSTSSSGSSVMRSNDLSQAGYTGYTSYAGGGAAHNNMPPYMTVYMWRRVA